MLSRAWNAGREVDCVRRGHAQMKLPGGTTYSVLRCQQPGVPWNLNKQMSVTFSVQSLLPVHTL